jgi:(p)ppGpp synthase/HD superfamily hydrolase
MNEKMPQDELITRALAHATRAHAGQVDKRGRAYLQHVTEVAHAVSLHGAHAIATALLHDVLEDTQDTDLSPYPNEVREAVEVITRQEGETYATYIERIARTPLARVVKLADLHLNHATAPEERLRERYARAITRLEQQKDQH